MNKTYRDAWGKRLPMASRTGHQTVVCRLTQWDRFRIYLSEHFDALGVVASLRDCRANGVHAGLIREDEFAFG